MLVHGRVELRKGIGTLFVHARKTGRFDGLSTSSPPQQSDYLTTWESHKQNEPKADGKIKAFLRTRQSPSSVETISRHLNRLRQHRVVWRWKRNALHSNRRFYILVKRWDVLTRDVTGTGHQL